MDLKQLEHFVAVAEERHFTRAARRLNVVQSGLSATIRALEQELGGPLFLRSTRRVDLTPAGKVLFDEAPRVLAAARDAQLAVMQVHCLARGRLTIGAIANLAPFADLPAALGRFHKVFDGIDIELVLDGSAPLIDMVRDNQLDIAFTRPPDPVPAEIALRMLACEGLVVICPQRHRLAGARDLPLGALMAETFVDLKADWSMRQLIDRSFAAAGLQRRIGFEVNDMAMLTELAAEGLAIALVPELVARSRKEDPRAAPIGIAELHEDHEPCWELAVAFKGSEGEPANPVAKAFLDFLAVPPVRQAA